MPNSINFNGTTYNSLDDMPADVRQIYEKLMGVLADKNQDGVPDALEGLVNSGAAMPLAQGQATIVYNGQVYRGLDQLPPEARAKYEKFQNQFDANGNGIPDMVEGMLGGMTNRPAMTGTAQANAAAGPAFAASAPIAPSTPSPFNQAAGSVVSPEGGDNRMRLAIIAIAGLGVMVCVLVAVVVWALAR